MKNLILLILLAINSLCFAATDLRSDTIDLQNFNLKLDLTDFSNKILVAEAEIQIKALQNNVKSIRLDLLKLTVDSVKFNGGSTVFAYNDTLLTVTFPTVLNKNQTALLQVFYRGKPLQMPGDFGGFYWTNLYAFNIGVTFTDDPHSYGRVWFPCFDNFRQRSYYEFEVTTKNVHRAFCNGILQNEVSVAQNKIWYWKLNQAIPAYLASLAVSQYEVLIDTVQGLTGAKSIQLAARASDTAKLKNLFVHLPDAFYIYENLFGAYLWDRVGYCIVPFNAGAMEHATNIAFMQAYLTSYADDCEKTMAHELSHHWFGNLVTCDSASEMWLNEGWARYCERLFLEKLYGDSVYKQSVRELHNQVLYRTHIADGDYFPVSGVPSPQTYSSTVYDKGSDMIHSLRWLMGESSFMNCIKSYINQFKWQTVSTAQMRDYFSQCSGVNLQYFFDNWIYAKGFTHFSIENLQTETQQQRQRVKFTIRQKLHQAPYYFTNVPVTVHYFTGNSSSDFFVDTVWVSGACTDHISSFAPPSKEIKMVVLDFDEKLQDAISDFWLNVNTTGIYDFDVARTKLNIQQLSQPTLVRVEHNWIRPEPMKNKINGLHLLNRRFWTVDGTWNEASKNDFDANATFTYDGADAGLDKDFFVNTEDSLVLMFRANSNAEWNFADSFFIDKKNSSADKKGEAIVYGLQKGEYCFAIWNHSLADTTTADDNCFFTSIAQLDDMPTFTMFPNPANEELQLIFKQNSFSGIMVFDIAGRLVAHQKIPIGTDNFKYDCSSLSKGVYWLEMRAENGQKSVQHFVKN
jgi:aminopeptidase N